MSLINTFINLNQQMLSIESPLCEGKLQIKLDSDSYFHGKEEFYLHSQRCDMIICIYIFVSYYKVMLFNMLECDMHLFFELQSFPVKVLVGYWLYIYRKWWVGRTSEKSNLCMHQFP